MCTEVSLATQKKSSGGGVESRHATKASKAERRELPVQRPPTLTPEVGVAPSPPEPAPCPICAARRRKKAAAQKKWRQKDKMG